MFFITNHGFSLLTISSTEVFYSYKIEGSSLHHLVKANYILTSGSTYSLNEEYHQTMNGNSQYGAISCLDHTNETIWHAVNMDLYIVYFQYNLTDYSLIGNKYVSSQAISTFGLHMEVAEGIICILSDNAGNFLLIVNSTTQEVIQVYDNIIIFISTPSVSFNFLIRNGHINIIGCDSFSGPYWYHNQIPTSSGYEDLLSFSKNSTYTFPVTSSYNLVDVVLSNHSMNSDTNPSPYTLTSASYAIQTISNMSYVLSLPDSLNHTINGTYGQVSSFDLPWRADSFRTSFTACEVSEDLTPSWMTVNCANSSVEATQNENVSSYFTVNSIYASGVIVSSFNVTFSAVSNDTSSSTTNAWGYSYWTYDSRYGPIYESAASTTMAQVITFIGIFVGLTTALLSATPAQDAWAIIHFLQLILVLPLVAISMNNKVKDFIVSNAFAALSVYILPLKAVKSNSLIKDLSFYQPDEYLRSLGWSSGSTLVNNFMLLIIISVLGIIHLVLYLIKNKQSKYQSMVVKIYKFFTLTFYIRTAIELFMFNTLMIVSEFKHYAEAEGADNFGHQKAGEVNHIKGNFVSIIFSCLMLILCLSFLLFTFFSWKENKENLKFNDECITREFYLGLLKVPKGYLYQRKQEEENHETQNPNELSKLPLKIKIARLYSLMFLVRRLMMIFLAVLIPSSQSSFSLKISILFILQTAWIAYAWFIRSFDKSKDQIVEAINEVVYLILMMFLAKNQSESRWTGAAQYVFISIILWQLWILVIVSIITAVIKLIRIVKRYKNLYGMNYSEQTQNWKLPSLNINDTESPFPIDENFRQNMPDIPQGSNSCIIGANDNQNLFEEDKKDCNQSHNSAIL